MSNNEVLRRLRYVFDLNDSQMSAIFALTGSEVSRAEICDLLKPDDDASFVACPDEQLIRFLDGFIIDKRGPHDGPARAPETILNNNVVFRKIKIALNLQAEEVVELLLKAGFRLSKHELSAFFRSPTHKHYRVCQDQVLRYFLQGLQNSYRGEDGDEIEVTDEELELSEPAELEE